MLGEKGTVRIGGVAVNEIQHWEFAEPRPEDERASTTASYETTSVYGFGHPLYYDNVIQHAARRGRARDRRPRGPEVARAADRDLPLGARRPARRLPLDYLMAWRPRSIPRAIVDDGAQIGDGTRVWHWVHVCAGARIGARLLARAERLRRQRRARSATTCKIQNNVSVYDDVTLEDDVFCGPSMVFTNVYNPRAAVPRKDEYRRTLVRRGATLGANCTDRLRRHDRRATPSSAPAPWSPATCPTIALVVGVPARRIGWMSRHGERLALPARGHGEARLPGHRRALPARRRALDASSLSDAA